MLREMDLEPVQQWAKRYVSYVKPGERGKLEVDQEAVAFDVSPASKESLSSAIELVGTQDERASLAQVLLDR
jgi:hypothetical protein